MSNKNSIILSLIALIVSVFVLVVKTNSVAPAVGSTVTRYMNIPTIASTTTFSLTTTSLRLLATTTTAYNRVAATIRLAGCSTVGSRVHLNINNDVVATVSTGPVLSASTTEAIDFNIYSNPVSQNSVTGIANAGTCSVSVTEWLATR